MSKGKSKSWSDVELRFLFEHVNRLMQEEGKGKEEAIAVSF